MKPKSLIRTTAYITSLLWSLAIALNGLHLPGTTSKILGLIPVGLVLLFTAWDLLLWRQPPFILISHNPDLAGTWVGRFDSQWLDDSSTLHETSAATALVIKQTFTSLSITLVAEKSKSYSILYDIHHLGSGEYRINYQYANTPLLHYRQEMPAHAGSTELLIATARSSAITGEYWTNRLSRGTLTLARVSRKRASTLAEAQAMELDQSGGIR